MSFLFWAFVSYFVPFYYKHTLLNFFFNSWENVWSEFSYVYGKLFVFCYIFFCLPFVFPSLSLVVCVCICLLSLYKFYSFFLANYWDLSFLPVQLFLGDLFQRGPWPYFRLAKILLMTQNHNVMIFIFFLGYSQCGDDSAQPLWQMGSCKYGLSVWLFISPQDQTKSRYAYQLLKVISLVIMRLLVLSITLEKYAVRAFSVTYCNKSPLFKFLKL